MYQSDALSAEVVETERKPRWRLRGNAWSVLACSISALILLPLITVFYLALFPKENIWQHLVNTVLPGYIITTLGLMLGVGLGTLVIGVSSAWLITFCRFPGQRYLEWALLLPLAVPAYIIAYVYTDLLDFSGPVQASVRAWFDWRAGEYWFPPIRSLGGAISMLTLVLYPYVYLLARSTLLEQSPSLLEAGRSLGHGPWSRFFRITLPCARPALAVGLSLVLMETLNDFGTVNFFAVRSLSAGLFDTWMGMGNLGGAAQIACVMLGLMAVLISLERWSRRRQRHFQGAKQFQAPTPYQLRGWRAGLASTVCALPVVLGFLLPALVLAKYSLRDKAWNAEFQQFALNSLLLAGLAALFTLVLGVLLAYSRRLQPQQRWLQWAVRAASMGYALPGAVLAVGVLVPLAAFDNALDGWMRSHWGVSTGLLLSGSLIVVLFAYVVRFLAVALGAVESSLAKVTPSMDMAARSLGHGSWATLRRVHLPLMRSGLLTAVLLVFVDCMKELPATLLLRPFNFDTLATYVYQYASDERLAECAAGALLIVLAGLGPVILLSRTLGSARHS